VKTFCYQAPDCCPLCGGRGVERISSRSRDGAKLDTVACLGCGLLRSDPLPSEAELRAFYEQRYRMSYKGVREPKLKHVARAGRLAAERYRALSRFLQPPVFDVGSGGGEWLYVLGKKGIAAKGVEPDPGYAAFARRELQVDVAEGAIWDLRVEAASLGTVTLFHVLEHLRDPVEALRTCLGWVAENGCLIVEVPNLASPHQHPHKRFHPAHLFGFTPATLEAAARRAGGRPVEVRLSRFSRDVTVVIAKGRGAAVNGAPPPDQVRRTIAAVKPPALLRYCCSPATLVRSALRLGQFARETCAVWNKRDAGAVLDPVLRKAGI